MQLVIRGQLIHIKCASDTLPGWTKQGLSVNDTLNGDIWIPSATDEDTGNYTCLGTKLSSGTLMLFKSVAQVYVGGELSILFANIFKM